MEKQRNYYLAFTVCYSLSPMGGLLPYSDRTWFFLFYAQTEPSYFLESFYSDFIFYPPGSYINIYLSNCKAYNWLRSLAWTRHFGICYITHFIFIALYQKLTPSLPSETYLLTCTIQAFVLTEVLIRMTVYLRKTPGD